MVITPNHVYYFTFKTIFATLNAIYRVESITSYAELLANNIDIYKVTYQANGASDDLFKTDLDTIRAGRIVKLKKITNESVVIYIPEHLFDKIPDGSVQRYLKLGLVVKLGIFDNMEDLNVIKSEVDQIVEAMAGTSEQSTIFKVSDSWLTTAEYQAIETVRNANITQISNHFTEKQRLLKEIDSLKTKLKYYEDLLIATQ